MLVSNMLILVDVQYYTQHSGVASTQRLLQGGFQVPGFTAIKEYRLHSFLEEAHFYVSGETGFPHTSHAIQGPPCQRRPPLKVLEAADLYQSIASCCLERWVGGMS